MKTRVIAKLDIKPPYVVKPVHFEGLKKIGKPKDIISKLYKAGIDEIYYLDIVASLYRRNFILDLMEQSSESALVPLAVGGGIKSIQNCADLFHHGADKIIINTYALQSNPGIIDELSQAFGSQAIAVSIEAKKWDGWWECYSDCGRIRSGKNVIDWVDEVEARGAGEILIQSVDRDGRMRGFDTDLASQVIERTSIPVVVGSGASGKADIINLVKDVNPSGIALSSVLHYDLVSITEIRELLSEP